MQDYELREWDDHCSVFFFFFITFLLGQHCLLRRCKETVSLSTWQEAKWIQLQASRQFRLFVSLACLFFPKATLVQTVIGFVCFHTFQVGYRTLLKALKPLIIIIIINLHPDITFHGFDFWNFCIRFNASGNWCLFSTECGVSPCLFVEFLPVLRFPPTSVNIQD